MRIHTPHTELLSLYINKRILSKFIFLKKYIYIVYLSLFLEERERTLLF